jgi:acyl dehydratase
VTAVAAGPGARREVVLDAAPGLGGLYARAGLAAGRAAVAGPVRRALGGGRGDGVGGRGAGIGGHGGEGRHAPTLPAVLHRLDGVRPDAGHLTAYQHLVGEPGGDVLPAGYVHVLAFPVATALIVRPDFPLPALGMVHLANRVEQRRALRLTDTLDVRAWAEHLRPHRKGAQVDLVTEVRVAGSAPTDPPAWRGVSTYLAPGARVAGAAPDDAGHPDFAPPEPTGRWVLDAATGRRYATVSGDANPIHLSPLTARALGFPRAIAHGMYTAARALADVGARRGEAYAWDVEFASPVLLPGSPAVAVARTPDGWTVTAWDARRGRLHLRAEVRPLG